MAYEYEYRNSTYLLPRAAQSLKRTTSVVWAWRSSLYYPTRYGLTPPLLRCAARSFTRRPPGDTRHKGSARL